MTPTDDSYSFRTVADIMTKYPLTVTPSDSVGRADELMFNNRFRQLPVVKDKELVGIITDRDIRSFLGGPLMDSSESRERALSTAISEIMTSSPIALAPQDDLQEAVELLIEEKFGAIPVVDEVEGLVGIVTYVDVLRFFLNRLQND